MALLKKKPFQETQVAVRGELSTAWKGEGCFSQLVWNTVILLQFQELNKVKDQNKQTTTFVKH